MSLTSTNVDIASLLNDHFSHLEEKLAKLSQQLNSVESKMDELSSKVTSIEYAVLGGQNTTLEHRDSVASNESPPELGDDAQSDFSSSAISISHSFLSRANVDQGGYEFEFDQVFTNPKTRPLFLQHCEREKNSENTEFISQVDKFTVMPSVEKAEKIVETFIALGAPKELNIPNRVRENISNRMMSPSLDVTLFNEAYSGIMITLKLDTFSRFLRSEQWLKFVSVADPELLQQVGIAKSKIPFPLLEKADLETSWISERDIQFAQILLKDFAHWEVVSQNKDLNVYCSSRNFVSDEAAKEFGYMYGIKCVSRTIDYPAKYCLEVLSMKKYFSDLGMEPTIVDYVPANFASKKYATVVGHAKTHKRLFAASRESVTAVSAFYDKKENYYVRIMRTCSHKKATIGKNSYRICLWNVDVFQEVSSFQCKYIRVSLFNPKGFLEVQQPAKKGNKLLKFVIKVGSSAAWKHITRSLEDAVKTSIVQDDMKVMQTLKDNHISGLI